MKLSTRELATIAVFGTLWGISEITLGVSAQIIEYTLQRCSACGHRSDHRPGGTGICPEKGIHFVHWCDCHATQIVQPGWGHHWPDGRDHQRGAGSRDRALFVRKLHAGLRSCWPVPWAWSGPCCSRS